MRETTTQLITAEGLRDLYEVQLLSEAQIAERLGTQQVYIGRLRKRYGIPTMSQGDRALKKLPSLTEAQRELVMGSLLGDGWMTATSDASARFQEGHCEAQAAYADWKADQLGPFVSSRFWREKKDKASGKVFKGRSFFTFSCPQFRPFYDLFYPAPQRKRQFPPNLHELMTPRMLALWYLDDGSIGRGSFGGHTPRIAFGLDEDSLKRCVRALKALGLKPTVYGEGGNRGIWFLKQVKVFRDIIEAYVPPCMSYKLPAESPRQAKDRNARKLTPEEACRLSQSGVTDETLARLYGVGVGTVRRRLREGGAPRRKPGPKGQHLTVEAVSLQLEQKYPDTSLWNNLISGEEEDTWIRDVLLTLRKVPFPYPEMESETVREQQLKTLASMAPEVTLATTGLRLCYPFFPNRYHAEYQGVQSAYAAWFDDKALSRAIRWQFKVGDPVTPRRVLRAVTANARTPTVFRPAVAKALYQKFCPPGGTVWDPCAGFGGRLLGAFTAGVGRYIGTDVAPETVEGNLKMAAWLGAPGGFAEVQLMDAAKFEPPSGLDMVFTSPPYFQQERYAGGEQSWQHETIEAWVEGFLRPVVQRGANALRSGGYWVMNIADVTYNKSRYPLVEVARREFLAAGLVEKPALVMPLSNLNRRSEGEPILVWRKT
jgi:hypothetical protein